MMKRIGAGFDVFVAKTNVLMRRLKWEMLKNKHSTNQVIAIAA